MAAKINVNRYRIITLLYLVFVCLSVISIPKNLLDPTFYTLKTFGYEEAFLKERINQYNHIINSSAGLMIKNDTVIDLVHAQQRMHAVYEYLDSIDKQISARIINGDSTLQRNLNNTRILDNIFRKDSLIYHIRYKICSVFSDAVVAKYFKTDSLIKTFPLDSSIVIKSGKIFDWEHFFFLHKPLAISFEHFKRMKVLLLTVESTIALKALEELGYTPAFFNEKMNKVVALQGKEREVKNFEKENTTLKVKFDSSNNKNELMRLEINKELQKNDSLSNALYSSLFTKENYYVGIKNGIGKKLREFLLKYSITVKDMASGKIVNCQFTHDSVLYFLFQHQGYYKLELTEKAKSNASVPVYSKVIYASNLPTPIVFVQGVNTDQRYVNIATLLKAGRLIPKINLEDSVLSTDFPGTILSFRMSRRSVNGKQEKFVYNDGSVFNTDSQQLIKSLVTGDVLIFDDILIRLDDKTTRVLSPLTLNITN